MRRDPELKFPDSVTKPPPRFVKVPEARDRVSETFRFPAPLLMKPLAESVPFPAIETRVPTVLLTVTLPAVMLELIDEVELVQKTTLLPEAKLVEGLRLAVVSQLVLEVSQLPVLVAQ
jgi:hypothetical protein